MNRHAEMNRKKIRFSLVLLLILSLLATDRVLSDGKIKYTGIFSSLEYHKGSGDLAGAEFFIVYTQTGLQGVMQIAEGGPSQLILIPKIEVKDDYIEFKITDPEDYRSIFKGRINKSGMNGRLLFDTGGVLDLKLLRKHSYWE